MTATPAITVNVIASGSKGNCTALTIGKAIILLDAGVKFSKIQEALNFENPLAALITHEHGDHANLTTINELLTRGVNVYMSKGTADALKLEPRHNLFIVKPDTETFILEPPVESLQGETSINEQISFKTFSTTHDAAEPLGFEISPHAAGYFIDTSTLPPIMGRFPQKILLIECNHDEQVLRDADIDPTQKQRILHNHLSVQKVVAYINYIVNTIGAAWVREVHLLHMSKRHGDADLFWQMVQEVAGDKVKVFAY